MAIVHFRSEDLHLVFLGDLGHPLTEAELAPLRGADIVLAAAGGPPTIDYPDIPALMDAIGPRIVVPMHFKTPKIDLNIQPLERFLEALPRDPIDRPGATHDRDHACHTPPAADDRRPGAREVSKPTVHIPSFCYNQDDEARSPMVADDKDRKMATAPRSQTVRRSRLSDLGRQTDG